jgi:hypothetical protein
MPDLEQGGVLHEAGSMFISDDGTLWLCTVTGAPGTWMAVTRQGPPAGAVMFFNLAACPAGWSEFAPAQGRTVVGTPVGGTTGGVVGVPLANLENRPHTHSLTRAKVDPSTFSNTNAVISANTGATSAVTPFVQLLTCQKD